MPISTTSSADRAASGGITGRLKIGVSEGVFSSPQLGMQKVLARLMEPDFDVFIDLFLGIPSELEQRLADGDRDIVMGPLTQKAPGVIYRPFFEEPHFSIAARAIRCSDGAIKRSTRRRSMRRAFR